MSELLRELIFEVREAPEGGDTARALGESIFAEADDRPALEIEIRDAVECHDEAESKPAVVRLQPRSGRRRGLVLRKLLALVALAVSTCLPAAATTTVSKPPDQGAYWYPLSPATGSYVFADSFVAPSNDTRPTQLGTWLQLLSSPAPSVRFEIWAEAAGGGPDPAEVMATTGSISPAATGTLTYFESNVVGTFASLSPTKRYWFVVTVVGESGAGEYKLGGHTQNSVYADNGTQAYSNDPSGVSFDAIDRTPEMSFQVRLEKDPLPVWDHANLSFLTGANISGFLIADDFVVSRPETIRGATLWLIDSVAGDNGILDSFSGGLGWAIYADNGGGYPFTQIQKGNAFNVTSLDTGKSKFLGTEDVFQVTFEFPEALPLDAGTYFLALHEGGWGVLDDGSNAYWATATTVTGAEYRLNTDYQIPAGWSDGGGADDLAFTVFENRPVWDQGGSAGAGGIAISGYVAAADVSFPRTTSFSTLDVWLSETLPNDNGFLDNFSGTLSWAIYTNNAGKPGTQLASGADSAPPIADTGRQASASGSDLVRARVRLGRSVTLPAGTYWVVLHEGAWGSGFDGTGLYWDRAFDVRLGGVRQDPDPVAPTAWATTDNFDPAFVLFDDQLFATGFEAGGACAWTNGSAIDCP